MTTKKQATAFFTENILPTAPDCIPGRREAWHVYADGLHKNGEISDHQVENWVTPPACNRRGKGANQ